MGERITLPAIRVKVTGACNRTCSFCHEEGDMRTIREITPDREFFECIQGLADRLGVKRIMLTGGEPTIHPRLAEILTGIRCDEISITSNGIRPIPVKRWMELKTLGLSKLILSIHDASIQPFLGLETKPRTVTWAMHALEAQRGNLVQAWKAGLAVRANIVVYHSAERTLEVLHWLSGLQSQYNFEVRLLNDLSNIDASQGWIDRICSNLEASEVDSYRRAGTSNVTRYFKTPDGFSFSTKTAYRYFFGPVCDGCPLKQSCHEGFYGLRLERRADGYYVRLCIYKHEKDVLMHWQEFLASTLPDKMRESFVNDLS